MIENNVKIVDFNIVKKTIKNTVNEVDDDNKKNKQRKEVCTWKLIPENYLYEQQMNIIQNIKNNNYHSTDYASKLILQQIRKKIHGYKHQDNLKKKYNETNFVNLEIIIDKMIDCQLNCYYCKTQMNVLYDISREMTQWTIDRIDNDDGHNYNNFFIACLECNLKRRCRNDAKFLFTKQLTITKTH